MTAPDSLTGRPILTGDGRFSAAWAKAETRYWRAYCRNAGECHQCGEKLPRHEDGCTEAPDESEDA